MIDSPIPEITHEKALETMVQFGGDLQKMAQYFYELGHAEGEIYMADKINSAEQE
jgi:hypothetical protein